MTTQLLIDVRTKEEFDEGSLDGAINIPLNEMSSRIDEIKYHGAESVVVFCASGARSAVAKMILEQAGLKQVINGGSYMDFV